MRIPQKKSSRLSSVTLRSRYPAIAVARRAACSGSLAAKGLMDSYSPPGAISFSTSSANSQNSSSASAEKDHHARLELVSRVGHERIWRFQDSQDARFIFVCRDLRGFRRG